MLNLLLLVQSEHDVAALPAAGAAIKAAGVGALWVVHSPAVVVDMAAQNAELDKQIAALDAVIEAASKRRDFTGAAAYADQQAGLVLQKSGAVKDAYKHLTKEQQDAGADRIFLPFVQSKPAPKMVVSQHVDHYETKDWIEMVNSLKGRWPAELPMGDFMVSWPGQVAQWGGKAVSVAPVVTPAAPAAPVEPKPKAPRGGYMGTPRYKLLCGMGIDSLGQEAMRVGISKPGGSRMAIVHAIMKAEHSATV